MSTGTAFFLIAVGAILRFAFATTSTHGLDMHVVGVILILIGVVAACARARRTRAARTRAR